MKSDDLSLQLNDLSFYTPEEQHQIKKCYFIALEMHKSQKRKSGEPYVIHPIAVANILIEHQEDCDTVCAGLLHDTIEDTGLTKPEITHLVNANVAYIVDGVTRITNYSNRHEADLASTRKLINSIAKDVRVLKVKLADRVHNMQTLKYVPVDTQKRKADETLNVFVPIAKEIGAYRIKRELEDLSFQYLQPNAYQGIEQEIKTLVNQYQSLLDEVMQSIQQSLNDVQIDNKIKYQVKNAYGIYRDIKVDHRNVFQFNDIFAIKVLVNQIEDCFKALEVIDNKFIPDVHIANYINNPKPDGYQSLHTQIFIPNHTIYGQRTERVLTKIRTFDMDHKAVYGLNQDEFHQKGANNMFLSVDDMSDQNFQFHLRKAFNSKKIFVYAGDGHIRSIPRGATVIDFAYSIHTNVGNQMTSANVNGVPVSFNYQLQDGDFIQIIKNGQRLGPSLQWLDIARTPYAREEIKKGYARMLKRE